MKTLYSYKAFGLIIQSEFEIPELLVSKGSPDVEIKIGKVPERLEQIVKNGVAYQAAKDEFILEVDQVARYFVRNGTEIIVEPNANAIENEIRLFMLGSVFGALFIQRGMLPIHGSAIKAGSSACIFSGQSGVGKSSIAAYFVTKGFKFLTDDISVIDDNMNVVPGFPNMKIWKDILNKLKVDSSSLSQIRQEIKKYHLPLTNSFYIDPLPLLNIFILGTKNTQGFEFEELSGLKKFNAAKNNTYRYRFVGGLDKQQNHFQILNKLLPKINVYKVLRPQSPILLDEFAKYLINTFGLNPNHAIL